MDYAIDVGLPETWRKYLPRKVRLKPGRETVMKFELVRPCKDCPFRSDITFYLTPKRVREILDSITTRQQTFSCHKTNSFEDDGEIVETKDSQHCAGAMILLERINRPNQMMRIAERLRIYDRAKLEMESPVFRTPAAMIKHFDALNGRKRKKKVA
jgi:hypothetical protein